jgi:hypothetical protein
MFNAYLHATITKSCPSTQYVFAPHQRSMFICLFSIRFFTKTLESPSCVCTIKLVYNSLWTYSHKSYMLGNLFKLWHCVKILWYYIHYIKFANIILFLMFTSQLWNTLNKLFHYFVFPPLITININEGS